MDWGQRFNICEAYYMYHVLYHRSLQTERDRTRSPERWILNQLDRLRFRPSPLLTYETMTDEARSIFNDLVNRYERKR